jgi:ADP-ribosylglycohydrolase
LVKALGLFFGNMMGDALGVHTEFLPFDEKRILIKEDSGWEKFINNFMSEYKQNSKKKP